MSPVRFLRGAVPDRPHDPELAGIYGSREHALGKSCHTVVQRDRFAGLVAVTIQREDADLHIEPLVAVEDIVASIALERVAAVTAEEQVASDEGVGTNAQHVQHLLQALDQGDGLCVDGTAQKAFGAALGRWQAFCLPAYWHP